MKEAWKREPFIQFENEKLCQVSVEFLFRYLFRRHFLLHFGNFVLLGLLVLMILIRQRIQTPKQIQTIPTRVGRGSLRCQSCLNSWTHSLVCCNFCASFERRTCHFLLLTGVLDGVEDFVDPLRLVGWILHMSKLRNASHRYLCVLFNITITTNTHVETWIDQQPESGKQNSPAGGHDQSGLAMWHVLWKDISSWSVWHESWYGKQTRNLRCLHFTTFSCSHCLSYMVSSSSNGFSMNLALERFRDCLRNDSLCVSLSLSVSLSGLFACWTDRIGTCFTAVLDLRYELDVEGLDFHRLHRRV